MSGFSAGWLALREPYDAAARNRDVLTAVAAACAGPAIAVTDLGCGTGSTLRALSPLLPAQQSWRLVDNDPALLEIAARTRPVKTVVADLAADLETVLHDVDLVTTSALLDLVSAAWLDRLVIAAARLNVPFYAALSYDGVVTLTPASQHDAAVIAAVNRHQGTDKGFGPALGPTAAAVAPQRFRAAGFTVTAGPSDWVCAPHDRAIQMELLAGWASAAGEIGVAGRDRRRLARRTARPRRGRPLAYAGRSRRCLRAADGAALSRQVAVEQHFGAQHVRDGVRRSACSQRVIGARSRLARPPPRMIGATTTWSRSRQRASRKRATVAGPAFDEDAPQPAVRKALQDVARVDAAAGCRQDDVLDAGRRSGSGGRDQQPPHAILAQRPRRGRQPAARIDDDAGRARPVDAPHRQQRSSAIAVPTPTTTASIRARSRCRWSSPSAPLM